MTCICVSLTGDITQLDSSIITKMVNKSKDLNGYSLQGKTANKNIFESYT